MAITAAQVKELREMTGAGMMDCKKALTATEGDMDKAVEFLREKGLATAQKKASRVAAEGLCKTLVSEDGKKAVVVEVNAETDFVAKNEKFQNYVADVAAQAMNTTAADIDAFLAEAWALDTTKTVKEALAAITECARTKEGNLLELAVKAAGLRASLGEISDACEEVAGRYKAIIRTISGVYSSETKKDADFVKACELAEAFAKKEGRQPRIMVAKMGQDGHDRGAKVVATGYADCGFDVDMGPLFQTPAEAAKQAVENDVHVMGISSLAAGHKTLVPQVIAELKAMGREDIVVIAGGVIPAQDYDYLYKAGVAAIFGPGSPVAKAACTIMEILLED